MSKTATYRPEHDHIIRAITYAVTGSKGDAYTVSADPKDGTIVACTCPSNAKGGRFCKHMRHIASGQSGIKPRIRVVQRCHPAAETEPNKGTDWATEAKAKAAADRAAYIHRARTMPFDPTALWGD